MSRQRLVEVVMIGVGVGVLLGEGLQHVFHAFFLGIEAGLPGLEFGGVPNNLVNVRWQTVPHGDQRAKVHDHAVRTVIVLVEAGGRQA